MATKAFMSASKNDVTFRTLFTMSGLIAVDGVANRSVLVENITIVISDGKLMSSLVTKVICFKTAVMAEAWRSANPLKIAK